MPKMTKAYHGGELVSVAQALKMRDRAKKKRTLYGFKCQNKACRMPVRPHKAGGHTAAHFEHLERCKCPLSCPHKS